MSGTLQKATELISFYTFGMDTGDWELATKGFADSVEVDYSAVGAPKGQMTKVALKDFLLQLLGKNDLRVHTAISQIFENPKEPQEYIAYYSVRHYKGQLGQGNKFAVFGWYSYKLHDNLIVSLKINVSAMEGDPTVLA